MHETQQGHMCSIKIYYTGSAKTSFILWLINLDNSYVSCIDLSVWIYLYEYFMPNQGNNDHI